jgi:excisionase family DNA binding protein
MADKNLKKYQKVRKLNNNEHLLDVQETATYLNLPKSTTYMLCEKRILPCVKIGKHWRCKKETLDEWLVEQAKHPSPDKSQKKKTRESNA